jgi:hypothetical protein
MLLNARTFDLARLLEHLTLGQENEAVALGEVFESLGDLRKEFDGVILDGLRDAANLGVKVRSDGHRTEALECVDESVGKALQAVSVLDDAFALDIVEDFANLLGRELVVV